MSVKCVAWDIDNTLLTGTFIESGTRQPPADAEMVTVLAELGRRGIVHAIASRNPPAAAAYAAQVTGSTFVAVECGWDRKSAAIGRIVTELGIGADALAFVDDDPYERAEVTFALPDVLVLSPEDMTDALGWTFCVTARRRSPSPWPAKRICPGCTSFRSARTSSTRPGRGSPKPHSAP